MLTRRVLFTSLCTAVVGIGFALPAFSNPPYSQAQDQYAYLRSRAIPAYPGPSVGYPCTWSGSRDLAHGETAYRSGRYADAITRWKTAASKDCAIAAYKLGMLYYGGKSQIVADRSLGTAWLKLAADSKTASNPYYQKMSRMAVGTLTKSQQAEYTADYARLRASLELPTAG